MVKKVKGIEEFETVIKESKIVLVDFWAEWCSPCQMVGPILEELDSRGIEDLTVVKVNVDENPDLAAKFRIMSIPTMRLFKDGELANVEPKIGVPMNGADELVEWVKSV